MSNHPPRILLLYGSLRGRSYSRLLAEEAADLWKRTGYSPQSSGVTGIEFVVRGPSLV
jgi:hypothetical protein